MRGDDHVVTYVLPVVVSILTLSHPGPSSSSFFVTSSHSLHPRMKDECCLIDDSISVYVSHRVSLLSRRTWSKVLAALLSSPTPSYPVVPKRSAGSPLNRTLKLHYATF